jgi:DNA-binding NarL/FixJ family response regulator
MAQPDSSPNGGVLIVDSHHHTVLLLRELLHAAFPVLAVGIAARADEALRQLKVQLPSVVIMDIALSGIKGIDAACEIKATSPAAHLVIHTIHDEQIFRDKCAAAGASGFVSKLRTHTDLVPVLAPLLRTAPTA